VRIEGRSITKTFWGNAWCENLQRYSDYANRLPRGRTYVRNGSVLDLQITTGAIHACVCGSKLYDVQLKVAPVGKARWKSICNDCAGAIDSLVELLQGRLSQRVMERICRQSEGLFPTPEEMQLTCTCPDWADMCKHVAAVLYGVGTRFDNQPELLFRLRAVDEMELIANASAATRLVKQAPATARLLDAEDLSAIFGLEIAQSASPAQRVTERQPKKPKPAGKAAGETLDNAERGRKRLPKALRPKTSRAN
jgi:uncharacterized Zn finger protein